MSLAKPAALFVCIALAGCAGKSDTGNALAKDSRPTLGGEEKAAQVEAAKPRQAAQRTDQAAETTARKVEKSPAENKAQVAQRGEPTVEAVAAKPTTAKQGSRWWPFGANAEKKAAPATLASKVEAKKAAPQQVSKAWLDDNEKLLKAAVSGSKFEVERRGDLLVVVAPADVSFNPDRPAMLMPVTLGPLSRVAKLVEKDKQSAVLVLGHADSSGDASLNRKLSLERAQAMASIFRMSGLRSDRLMLRGVGSSKPRASNDDAKGRAQNRRVELILTPRDSLSALVVQNER
ncbi:putative lipoprotein YiaD precursor [compost metagenome]